MPAIASAREFAQPTWPSSENSRLARVAADAAQEDPALQVVHRAHRQVAELLDAPERFRITPAAGVGDEGLEQRRAQGARFVQVVEIHGGAHNSPKFGPRE